MEALLLELKYLIRKFNSAEFVQYFFLQNLYCQNSTQYIVNDFP